MQIYYFSTALSDKIYKEIADNCKKFKPTFSGVGFDRNIATGISKYTKKMVGISLFPLPSWPKYKYLMHKKMDFEILGKNFLAPTIIDFPLVKEWSFFLGTIRSIKRNYKKNEKTVILISGLYRSFLRVAKHLKKKYDMPIYVIVPDVPELMMTYRKDYSKLRQYLNKVDIEKSCKYRECVDGFVFLSKYMNEFINQLDKPYIVVDGLCDISSFPIVDECKDNFILYAGKISNQFGVKNLVEGFIKADIPNLKLYLCGDGDYSNELERIANQNKNVVYFGVVTHGKVLELEKQAKLLVEPRPTDNDIVKMSFPSKIIEYMASGTPVLTTNLPCYDDEYKDFQYRIDDESVDGIANALSKVFELDDKDRREKGITAKEFIVQYKTIDKQCEKIAEFIKRVEKNENR